MLESCFFKAFGLETMVTVAQLVESRIVIPVVVGSSPIGHPRIPLLNQAITPLPQAAFFVPAPSLTKI